MRRVTVFAFVIAACFGSVVCLGSAARQPETNSVTTAQYPKSRPVEDIYTAEEMPKFQNGWLPDFGQWVMKRIVYPEDALGNSVQTRVVIKFSVETDGSIVDVQPLYMPVSPLTQEFVRVMKLSPAWTPAKQDGVPVRIAMIFAADVDLQYRETDFENSSEMRFKTTVQDPSEQRSEAAPQDQEGR